MLNFPIDTFTNHYGDDGVSRNDLVQIVKNRELQRLLGQDDDDPQAKKKRKQISSAGFLTDANIEALSTETSNSAITFTFFISFLIGQATSHPRSFYEPYVGVIGSFICIEGRAIAAVMGTLSLFLIQLINYQRNNIMKIPVGTRKHSKLMDKEVRVEVMQGHKFIQKVHWIAAICRYTSWFCLFVFLVAFIIGMASFLGDTGLLGTAQYYIFIIIVIAVMLSGIGMAAFIFKEGIKFQAKATHIMKKNMQRDPHWAPDDGSSVI